MKPYGLFVNGYLIETYSSYKKVLSTFKKLCLADNNLDIVIVKVNKGIILQN